MNLELRIDHNEICLDADRLGFLRPTAIREDIKYREWGFIGDENRLTPEFITEDFLIGPNWRNLLTGEEKFAFGPAMDFTASHSGRLVFSSPSEISIWVGVQQEKGEEN